MGIATPRYDLTQEADTDFWSGAAVFTDFATPEEFRNCRIGEVRHVYGKKAARHEVSMKVAEFLDDYVKGDDAAACEE
jgi:hypothetical protein